MSGVRSSSQNPYVLQDLEHIPWNFKTKVSGLSLEETAAMKTIIGKVMHFCCHTTKKMLYECALKDGTFVNLARKGLQTVLQQERAWCMWTALSHPDKKVRCNWTDEETTAHAMIRSVTHLHPIIMRYLISEFLQDRTVEHLQKTLRLCLYLEINYYRDKMNNWDCRIYNYICQNSDVCMQIVSALKRLEKDIVILEWMSDWTALLYFCQYERGPFYYFLHPIDTLNSKVLRSYMSAKQTTVCCTESIVSLSSLTESDYLGLIKEAWDSEISYTQVNVADTQIHKLEKFRKCVEGYFLHTQREFWKLQDRIRPNRTTKMFDDPLFPLLTKLSELTAGAFWSNLIQQWRKHGYFGENFVPNSLIIDSKPLLTAQISVHLPMTTSCCTCPQKLPIQTKANPYVLQVSGLGDNNWLYDGDDDKRNDDEDDVDPAKMQESFDSLFGKGAGAKERDKSLHKVSGDVVAEHGNTFKALGTAELQDNDDKFEFDDELLNIEDDDNAEERQQLPETLTDTERQQLQVLGLSDQQINVIGEWPAYQIQDLQISHNFKMMFNALEHIRLDEKKLETWNALNSKFDKKEKFKSRTKQEKKKTVTKWHKVEKIEEQQDENDEAKKVEQQDDNDESSVATQKDDKSVLTTKAHLTQRKEFVDGIKKYILRRYEELENERSVAQRISRQMTAKIPEQVNGDLSFQDLKVIEAGMDVREHDEAGMDVREQNEAGMDVREQNEAGMDVPRSRRRMGALRGSWQQRS
jgi:hypothetical protein